MINPYQEITNYTGTDFQTHLINLNLFPIFESVFVDIPDPDVCINTIKFIAYGYSMDSDQLATSGNNWKQISRRIFNIVSLPDEYFEQVCLLEGDGIRLAVEKWLQFQNDENWTQYIHYRDLRRQMLSFSLDGLKKSSGEIDIEAKYNAVVYSRELLGMMNQALDAFIQNHSKLKSGIEALNKANKEKLTRNVADYAL